MKILNILKTLKPYNFTNNVQDNITLLLKNFGNNFNIKYNKYILNVNLSWDTFLNCYVLCHDINNRTFEDYPFQILFKDITTTPHELNNNSLIKQITLMNLI